jgi:hypothetical protein
MSAEEPFEALLYSYTVDYSKPYFLAKKFKLFATDKSLVGLSPSSVVDGQLSICDSKSTSGRTIAASASVEASFLAFSGKASMAVTAEDKSDIQTMRISARVRAAKFTATIKGKLALTPHKCLEDGVVDYINDTTNSVQELCELFGPFFATQCTLGGVFEKNHVMEVTQQDTDRSVTAELSASYGISFCNGSGRTQFELKTRTSNSQARQSSSWHCEGGESSQWLGVSDSNFETIKATWAASVGRSNLFPFDLKLKPIWVLVNKVNPSRAAAMQQWFEAKWSREAWNPSRFVTSGRLKRIVFGEAFDPHRGMINHSRLAQANWDAGRSMNIAGWTHKLEFWAFDSEQPGTIRIAVGEAGNPHRVLLNHSSYSQAQWKAGQSMSVHG